MQTGIRFFDEREFQEGDLVVVAGGAASGKTTVASNLAAGLAANKRVVTHYDLESTHAKWDTRMAAILGGTKAPISYRNVIEEEEGLPAHLGKDYVVVDPVGLAVSREGTSDFVRHAKRHAVRQRTVVVLTVQLNRGLWRHLDTEGWVNPTELPEWVLEFADQIYLLRRTTAGLSVIRVKGDDLYATPEHSCTMILEEDGRIR